MESRLSTLDDKADLRGYLNEQRDNGEHNVLLSQDFIEVDYSAWVCQMRVNTSDGNGHWGSFPFLLCRDGDGLVGVLCIRYELPRELEEVYGNIGYSVRPSKHNRGYATEMPWHALHVCGFDMGAVTLGCLADNFALTAVIEKRGGVLVGESGRYEKVPSLDITKSVWIEVSGIPVC